MVGFLGRLFGRADDAGPEIPGMVPTGRRRWTGRPPAPAADGADVRAAMHLAVRHDTWLFDVHEGDFVDGTDMWGPFEPAACSEVLLRWFDAGLVELRQDIDHPPEAFYDPSVDLDYDVADLPLVPPGAARALLADPGRWTDATPDGFAVPLPTELGRRTPPAEWP
ncbi:hypothetical protein GCU60_03285 [Blastococcus saxobsidens]|uniref:Uncharacterized protein n=1 Tax=Blastococcus saxobsidens TaxID=138336 RepID=A0A6L9W028_9ACTN|nr:hypothetical protein [Blastococcus saxobsidens]NEK84790.1 hypothetical protein [Blastococcus saxobsidens]